MTVVERLYTDYGQSPWLDNLTRGYLRDGTLARMVADGIRGVTANPTIFTKAIVGSADYDEQFAALTAAGRPLEDAYWQLVVDDIVIALAVLRPVFDASGGTDGFVSIEVAPELARDTQATLAAARALHERIAAPNLFVKIPATAEGVPAIQSMIAEGRSINITLIFSLTRYEQIIEAYLSGLEAFVERGGDPSRVHSVASFFVSRVDTEVDRRLDDGRHRRRRRTLRGQAAIAQAKLAYRLFRERFAGERWQRLAALGAHPQRPLWASTSTKNPAYPDTRYVDRPHRPGHRQHPARGHHRRVHRPRHTGPHHRHRSRRGRRGDAPPRRRRHRHGRCRTRSGRRRASPPSMPRTSRCSRRSAAKADQLSRR